MPMRSTKCTISAHAFSMILSMGAVTLLPAYAKNYLPPSITSRPIKGHAPTVDLVVGYSKSRTSPALDLLLSRFRQANRWRRAEQPWRNGDRSLSEPSRGSSASDRARACVGSVWAGHPNEPGQRGGFVARERTLEGR